MTSEKTNNEYIKPIVAPPDPIHMRYHVEPPPVRYLDLQPPSRQLPLAPADIISHRVKEPRALRQLSPLIYEWYKNEMTKAMQSVRRQETIELLKKYNQEVAPMLRTEEAALQEICALAYMALGKNDIIRCCIESRLCPSQVNSSVFVRGLPAEADDSYAPFYKVSDCVKDPASGLTAWFLSPSDPDHRFTRRDIIVFQGTAMWQNAIAYAQGEARGIGADLDPTGIGRQCFDVCRQSLITKVEKHIANKHNRSLLMICGHSLGGALAARLWAAVSEDLQFTSEERANLRLLTDSAPGLDAETARKIQGGPGNIRLIRCEKDWVPKAGELHPRGLVLARSGDSLWNGLENHLYRWQAEGAISAGVIQGITYLTQPSDTWSDIECMRQSVGLVAACLYASIMGCYVG